tara:strand:- start:576 stop:1529 length:954 start_codon:yes stop_codon:yes gene_type:complete
MKSSGDLIASISTDLADNNAGLISAEDVRHNMEDTAFSINRIVASGDTETEFPFYNNVTISNAHTGKGKLFVESGIVFPNTPEVSERTKHQIRPWLGPDGIQHNQLAGLTAGDPHTQYIPINGSRALTGNFAAGDKWINSSGTVNGDSTDNGLQFKYNSPTVGDDVCVGTSGHLKFNKDNSSVDSFHGVAKAWLNFDGSGNAPPHDPVIRSYHNIHSLQRIAKGTFKITFTSGTFLDNNYVAIGSSNGEGGSGTFDSIDVNTVGILLREGDDATTLRSLHFTVKTDDNDNINAKINELVCYGLEPGSNSGVEPIIVT